MKVPSLQVLVAGMVQPYRRQPCRTVKAFSPNPCPIGNAPVPCQCIFRSAYNNGKSKCSTGPYSSHLQDFVAGARTGVGAGTG